MTAPEGPPAAEGTSDDSEPERIDVFAGLTPIDVIDGELVPRVVGDEGRSRRRRGPSTTD